MANPTTHPDQATRCREVGLAMGWLHPFFLIPLSYLKFEEVKPELAQVIPTMAVMNTGRVVVNPEFTKTLTDQQLATCVCHEIMHLVLQHHARVGAREKVLWNVAGDLAINAALRTMNKMDLPKGALLPPPGKELLTSEEWYEQIKGQLPPPGATGQVAAGCGVERDPDGENAAGDEDGEGDSEGAGGAGEGGPDWEVVAHQAQAAARGTEAARALAPLLAPKPAGVAWRQLLRSTFNRVAAAGGRDMQSMSRRNRRSPDGVILPGWISTRPTVAVVIDTSGSMSDEMLAQCVAEARAAGEAVGARVFLALHDAECYHAEWIDVKAQGAGKLGQKFTQRGGTYAGDTYERVGRERTRFDAMVHLTDGEIGQWPEIPTNVRRLVAAIVGPSRYPSAPPAERSVLVRVEVSAP